MKLVSEYIKIKNKIINLLNSKYIHNVAITFHFAPDADAIGSAVALTLALQTLNKKVDIIINSYSLMFNSILHNVNIIRSPKKKYDLCILVDCSSRERTIDLDMISPLLVVIDHHDDTRPLGNLYYCIPCAATTMIIFDLLASMKINITSEIATALYLGIFGDTSGFTNSNTNSLVLHYASLLLKKKADITIR